MIVCEKKMKYLYLFTNEHRRGEKMTQLFKHVKGYCHKEGNTESNENKDREV